MPALLAKLGMMVGGAIVPRGTDSATATVRIGRALYVSSLSYILALWYFGWRNQRVEPGSGSFPVPGLYKGPKTRDGADDADTSGLDGSLLQGGGGAAGLGAPDIGGFPREGEPVKPTGGGMSGNATLLVHIGRTAQGAWKLHVGEHPQFGGVTAGAHVATSYHYKGRAIDVSDAMTAAGQRNMAAFAFWVASTYGSSITELIWAGPNPIFIKNGRRVSASVYADVLASHRNHVHVAI